MTLLPLLWWPYFKNHWSSLRVSCSEPHPSIFICRLILELSTMLIFRYPIFGPRTKVYLLQPPGTLLMWSLPPNTYLPTPFAPHPSCLPVWTFLSPPWSVNMYFLTAFLEQLYKWHQGLLSTLLYISFALLLMGSVWILSLPVPKVCDPGKVTRVIGASVCHL